MRGMGGKSGWMLAAAMAASLAATAPATAWADNKGEAPAIAAAPADFDAQDKQEEADARIVMAALQTLQSQRAPGLKRKIPQIQAVLARAPAVYPLIERRGNTVISRSDNPASGLMGALMGINPDGAPGGTGGTTVVVQRFDTYIWAAFILGWYYNETRQPEEALEPLAKGLALQPGNARLTAEQNAAFIVLRRFPDALAANDIALAQPQFDDSEHAQLLRNRGYVLIELGRVDEAEAAYQESLKLEPGNRIALSELEYIRQQRAGVQPQGGVQLYTGDQPTPPADDKK